MNFLMGTHKKNKGLVLKLFENTQKKVKERERILTQIHVMKKKYLKGQVIKLSP